MIEYKGYTIAEGEGVSGVKIYHALRNPSHSIASNQSLAKIVAIIDEAEEESNK
jgi:hypothetical protein